MRLLDILYRSGIPHSGEVRDCEIRHLSTDPACACVDTLFICIQGTRHDTHSDIPALCRQGVRCFVVSEEDTIPGNTADAVFIVVPDTRIALAHLARTFYDFPDRSLTLVGITGTKGKTTVSHMLRAIWEAAGIHSGVIGTNGVFYGARHYETVNSTPDSLIFFKTLREMREAGITHAAIEVTSQALKQYRTEGTRFDTAVFTNLFPDHIGKGEHADCDEYRACKARLFENCDRALLNRDSSEYEYFRTVCRKNGVDVYDYSLKDAAASFYGEVTQSGMHGTTISFCKDRIHVKPFGSFNASNALCACALASLSGISVPVMDAALSNVEVDGRCERVPNCGKLHVWIDYAHNGESLACLLRALRDSGSEKIYCVFGCGGDRSPLRRAGMGEAAGRYADHSFVTADNPRHEEPEAIIRDILPGIEKVGGTYTIIPDRKEAILACLETADADPSGSVSVVIAGKGNQRFEEIGDERVPFDERQIVSEFFQNKKCEYD